MASGQKVIGRHEVFEYTYRMGPAAEERKRIKLVVIQRREQRRKSQIGVSKHLGTPVRLRVNLHRAQYGDPEVVSGSRHVPITLRRKVKPAPNTTVLRHGHGTRAPATTVVRAPVSTSPPPPEPTRIELVDSPVGSYVDDPPPPIVVVPPSQTPTPEPRTPSLVRTGSGSSIGRKPKRSNSITSGFRRFPSLMGMIRRNSKSSTPPSVAASEEQHVIIPGNYHDRELPQTPESLVIVEERESELGSPIGTSVRYGPPSVADTSISRRRPPPTVESLGSSRSGRSRNKLIKPPPHQVPLPDSLRHSDGTGTVASGYPVHLRQSAEYEPARSVTSRHTGEQRLITGPEYAETYLHDSPSARSRSLHNESLKSRSIHDAASARSHNRSLHDLSQHNRSAHDLSQHSQHSRSVHDLSMRTPSRHSHEASIRDGSLRDGVSLHELGGAPSLRGESIRDPSIREHSIRDPSIREHSLRGGGSIRDGGLYSPSASMREVLSEGDRENDHTYDYERGPHPHSRVASPSLHAPSTRVASPGYYRDGTPSIHAPSHRAMSPSVLAPSHRGASPSLHAPSYRGASPSLHAPSRGASPSLHDPSMRGGSPPVSMHAPSERSRVAPSVVSSKYPPSSINGRHGAPGGFGRPKSPLSASGSSHASSRRTGGPRGPDITAVPLPPPSVRSVNTTTTRNGLKSPHTRVASPPISEAPIIPSRSAPSVDGSFRSGRASELPYQATLPPSTYAPSAISRAPSAAPTSRAPSAAGTRIPTSSRGVPTAPSAGTFHSAVSDAPSRTTSAAGTHITRAPSAAGVPLPSSVGTPTVYAPSESGYSRAPSAAGPRITRVPSAAGVALPASVAGSTIYAPSTIGRARSPSVAGTQITRAPSAAGVPLPPSVVGSPTVYAPSARGHSRAPSVAGTQITRATSAARVPLPASVAGGSTVYAPSAGGHSRAPSAAAISRAPSAGPRITRVPSAAGTHRHAPSVSVSQRIPPSVIGSQRVPPSITGSVPSRHTPPPESEFLPAQSDIAPESESHGGQALRAQARLEGDKMGMFFQMANQAHKDGDGARAKELSDIGRQHQVRMQELNAEAASQIFKEKNVGRDENEIDLHGLYVKEALARLSQFIREAPRSGQTSLRIITGKGLHSDRGEAQIIPAVEESLRTKGLRHHTDESNAGVIVVELGPRSPVSD